MPKNWTSPPSFSDEAKAAFDQHVLAEYPKEAAGLLVKGRFIPLPNIHEEPNGNFRLDSKSYLKYEKGLQGVLHSHTVRVTDRSEFDPRFASSADMRSQMAMGIPWGISVTNGEENSDPLWFGYRNDSPLVGRQFAHAISDCYALVRDYFRQNLGIVLSDYPRDFGWWNGDQDLYTENFRDAGFTPVPIEEIKLHDVILIKFQSKVVNHAGIYLGDDKMMQHLFMRMSEIRTVSPYYKLIDQVVRHHSQMGEVNAS